MIAGSVCGFLGKHKKGRELELMDAVSRGERVDD